MLRPVGDNLIVEPITMEKSEGGILVPQTAQDAQPHHKGKVIAVGAGIPGIDGKYIPMEVKVGDVIFYRYGEDIQDGKDKYKMVREKEVVAIIE